MSADPNTVVVTSVAGTGVVVLASKAARGERPSLRFGVGLGFSALVLAIAAQFAPRLAAAFAVLLFTSSVFVYGGPALAAITRTTKPTR